MRLFGRNFEYKVIALTLAISLYAYTSDLISEDRKITFTTINADNVIIPEGYTVTSVSPNNLEVRIRGPRSVVRNYQTAPDLKLEIAARALDSGTERFTINNNLLNLDPNIVIESVLQDVEYIDVTFEEVGEQVKPIDDRIAVHNLPEGLQVTGIELQTTDVFIRGPRKLLSTYATLDVAPLDLSDVDPRIEKPIERQLPLQFKLLDSVELRDQQTVYAKVTIAPKLKERVVSLPIYVALPNDFVGNYKVELASPDVTLTVRGPQSLVDALKPTEQLQASIRVDADWPLDESRPAPVQIRGPGWMQNEAVQVRIRLVEDRPPEPLQPQQPITTDPAPIEEDPVEVNDPDGPVLRPAVPD